MRIRCPSCHAEHALEACLEDEAAREMMGLLADLPRETSRPLAAYLGLWRPKTRALGWERALRIARETLTLHDDPTVLGASLSETVEAIRAKRDQGADHRALNSHNYLRRVLESVADRGQTLPVAAGPRTGNAPAPSRSAAGLTALHGVRDRYE